MAKKLLQFLIIIIVGVAIIFFGLILYLNDAITSDPNYNTVYTKAYNESNFKSIVKGDSIEKVIKDLGDPFSKDSIKFNLLLIIEKF